VIATGSTPAVPPISGLEQGPYFTNETIFDLAERPAHLIVIGAGPIGLEMAQAFRRLGSSVTVLEQAAPLAKDDPECAMIVLDQLEREGIVIRSGVKVIGISHAGASITAMIESAGAEQTVTGSHLLVATGRKATTDGLNLDAAGIRADRSGIVVNKKLKTANRRVYAIGDCAAGQLQFTHAANYHAGLVIRNALFRLPVRVNNDVIPWVTYTEPELAQSGLTEAEARKRGIKIRILRWPYPDNDRAQAERDHGHIKVIKAEMVNIRRRLSRPGQRIDHDRTLAIAQGLNIRATGIVLPYPTLSEIDKRGHRLFAGDAPWVRHHNGCESSVEARLEPGTSQRRTCARVPRQNAGVARRLPFGLSGKLLFLTILFVIVAEISSMCRRSYFGSTGSTIAWRPRTAALVLDAAPAAWCRKAWRNGSRASAPAQWP
jgi:pyruvate/2-oxoglutarate dehydrogenase complex dihydrolipoamide dehydrogenase (E3) component